MKKAKYITPDFTFTEYNEEELICASIIEVGGDAGIVIGEGDTPTTADSRRNDKIWDDEELY
jgi:hypothetical protein